MQKLRRSQTGLFITAAIALVLLVFLFESNRMHRAHISRLETIIENQKSAAEQSRKKGLMRVMAGLFDQMERELPGELTDETIGRLALLSSEFEPAPYTYIEDDSMENSQLSRERGFLLKSLLAMNLDSASWRKIRLRVSFAKADLENAALGEANLAMVNLMGACMKGADLRGAVLDSSDLRGANLWGARLQHVSGRHALMNRADLRWANLDSADLGGAILNGSLCTAMKMRHAGMQMAQWRHAKAGEALLNRTDFREANLFGTDFTTSNLSYTDLQHADLRSGNLSGTRLNHAHMEGASFRFTGVQEENWFDLLENWGASGVTGIREKHRIFRDSSGTANYIVHPAGE